MFNDLINFHFLNNSGKDYLTAVIIFFALLVVFKIIEVVILLKLEQMAKKTKTNIADVLVEIVKGVKPPIYFLLSLYLSFKFLHFSAFANKIADGFLIFILVYQTVTSIQIFIDFLAVKLTKKEGAKMRSTSKEAIKI